MSVVNREHRHVFVHVPKCAGMSMERQPFIGGNGHKTAAVLIPEAPDFFSWGFVRNPYERVLSVYSALTQHDWKWPNLEPPWSFGDYIERLPEFAGRIKHAKSMTYFLCGDDGAPLVDFIGRYESLESDWRDVCLLIGVPVVELSHLNASEHGAWRDHYTDESLARVNEFYADDFRVFKYPILERVECRS